MHKIKKVLSLLIIFTITISLAGCRRNELADYQKVDSYDEGLELFNTGGDMRISHKVTKDNINDVNSVVIINEKEVGELKTKGFFNTKSYFIADGEKAFYVTDKGTDGGKALEEKFSDYDACYTYTYMDMDGNCMGYAQTWYVPFSGEDRNSELVFFDENGENKGIYIYEDSWLDGWVSDGATIYNDDNEEIGHIDFKKEGKYCYSYINLGEAKEVLSAADKTAIAITCCEEITKYYYDYSIPSD